MITLDSKQLRLLLNTFRKDTLTLSDRVNLENILKEELMLQQKHISNTEVYLKAIEQFGQEAQLRKAMEEAAEYIQAINKWVDKHDDNSRNNLLAEMADVMITMNQAKLILGIQDSALFQMVDFKTRKLASYLNIEE